MKGASMFLAAAVVAASGWVGVLPQDGGSVKVAMVNGDRVLEGSNIGKQAQQRLESEMSKWQERVTAANQELQTLTRQRQEQALTLNEQALARLNQDIEEKQVQVQRLNDDARRELQRLEQQVTLEVNRKLGPLVEKFAAERGFDLILDSARMQGILYFNNALDVTDDFLAVVNAEAAAGEQKQ